MLAVLRIYADVCPQLLLRERTFRRVVSVLLSIALLYRKEKSLITKIYEFILDMLDTVQEGYDSFSEAFKRELQYIRVFK